MGVATLPQMDEPFAERMRSTFVVFVVAGGMASFSGCGTMGVRKFSIPETVGPPDSVASDQATIKERIQRGAPTAGAVHGEARSDVCDVWLSVTSETKLESSPTCIKRPRAAFAFPSPIYLKGQEDGITDTQFNWMCADEGQSQGNAGSTGAGAEKQKAPACAWTYQYRESYPLSFRIKTNGEPLSHFAHVIRVFRNGKLVFSWKDDNVLSELVVPGAMLKAKLMPYGAPMDLRIIPAGSPDDPSLDTKVAQTVDPLITRMEVIKGVLLGPKGPVPTILPEIACVSWMVSRAEATAMQVLGKTSKDPGPAPAGCEPPADGQGARLHDEIVTAIQQGAQAVSDTIEGEITALGAQFGAAIATEAEKAKAALIKQGEGTVLKNGLTVSKTVAQINELAGQGAQIFDSVSASVRSVIASVKRLSEDRDAQARELAAVTEALAEQGSIFEPFTKNPALVGGEKSLDMRYGDRFQVFFLAPWHGLPFRVTRNVGTDLNLGTAIPILDVIGFRYQTGTGRSQTFRLGAGLMYFKDELIEMPLAGAAAQTESVFNAAVEANLNWLGFSLGAGYVLNRRNYGSTWTWDRFRLIAGADLLKLFGNKSAEAFAF